MTDRGLQAITHPNLVGRSVAACVPCAAGGNYVALPRHPDYARSGLTQHARTHARRAACDHASPTLGSVGQFVGARAQRPRAWLQHPEGTHAAHSRSARSTKARTHAARTHARTQLRNELPAVRALDVILCWLHLPSAILSIDFVCYTTRD